MLTALRREPRRSTRRVDEQDLRSGTSRIGGPEPIRLGRLRRVVADVPGGADLPRMGKANRQPITDAGPCLPRLVRIAIAQKADTAAGRRTQRPPWD